MIAARAGVAARWFVLSALCSACPAARGSEEQVVFPADFESHYVEMRSCRHSHEHELRFIRVLASETAQPSYAALSPDQPYPVGATLVKIEYDDPLCATAVGFTAMQKLEPGGSPDGGDWRWQKLSVDRAILEDEAPPRCVSCHQQHCSVPNGYDLSCAEEL